jgi:hypothetical protein
MGTGSKDCIVSLVERKSGLLLIGKLADAPRHRSTDVSSASSGETKQRSRP